MKTQEVNSKKFDTLMAKNITLQKCHKCGRYGGQIIIDMPMYGKDGVYCKCYEFGFETKRKAMNAVILDHENKRMGTPVIEKSLMSAIREAINDWNGRSENGKS